MLSPRLYSLFTHDCMATHDSNSIIKFADDTSGKPAMFDCLALLEQRSTRLAHMMTRKHRRTKMPIQSWLKLISHRANRDAQWSKALHRSASCATRDSGFESRLCRSRPRLGDPWSGVQLAQRCLGYGRVWQAGMSLSHCALATPVAGRAQCTLTQSPGVRCFLRHISATGFRVKWALCQEAVQLGWIVFLRTNGSRPSPLTSSYRSCSDETRL